MGLADSIKDVLSVASSLKAGNAANEANTRALVIEPVLAALGWNLGNFSEVNREYKVYDGTFLDYALQIDGKPKLFVEAKALGKSLADKQFIAQTVNYANNQGVVWCVLTNGLVYQVYKSNEPVPMERKLLFEVDLADAAGGNDLNQVISALAALGRTAVDSGQLESWGETVFTDLRVRAALSKLGTAPTPTLMKCVASAIDGSSIDAKRLRDSLNRLLGGLSSESSGALVGIPPLATTAATKSANPTSITPPVGKKGKTVEDHLAKKPSTIVDLFERVDTFSSALGPDVSRRPTQMYIGYFVGKRSFLTVELQKAKIWVYVSTPPSEAQPWSDSEMRDVTSIGHFGMGDTEFRLTSTEQLPRLEALLKQSYLRNRK